MPDVKLSTVDLLAGTLVSNEQYAKSGWIGIIVPFEDGLKVATVFSGQDLREYVQALIDIHGNEVRMAINVFKRHMPKDHYVCFVPVTEAQTKDQAHRYIRERLL